MRIVRVVLLIILFWMSEIAVAQSWIYYDIREPGNQFLLQSEPNKSAWMDIEGDAEFCGWNSTTACFKANEFRFAVPKRSLEVGAEWTYDGSSYRVNGKRRLHLLGKVYSVYFIDAKFEKFQMRFVYSRDAGLIAITTIDPTPGLFLILDGACGFASSAKCRRQ